RCWHRLMRRQSHIDAGRHHRHAHDAVQAFVEGRADDDVGIAVDLLANSRCGFVDLVQRRSLPPVIEMSRPLAPFIEVASISGLEIAASAAESARLSPEASPVPIIALPISRITARTSAKSRLIRPSLTIRSVMQATPE